MGVGQVARLKAISLFTGAGGLDLGFEVAGFEVAGFDTVACVERDAAARNTILENRGAWNLLPEGDVHRVAKFGLLKANLGASGEIDALIGSPPCQPFSAQMTTRRRFARVKATLARFRFRMDSAASPIALGSLWAPQMTIVRFSPPPEALDRIDDGDQPGGVPVEQPLKPGLPGAVGREGHALVGLPSRERARAEQRADDAASVGLLCRALRSVWVMSTRPCSVPQMASISSSGRGSTPM